MRAMASAKAKKAPKAASSGGAYVALLRGINVGGKRSLPMKKLAEAFAGAGCSDVRTYIQSGNVVFRAPPALAPKLASALPRAVAKVAGFDVPVVIRSADELRAAVKKNPFLKSGTAPELCHLMFLADVPEAARSKQLDATRSPPDELALVGRDVYLKLPNGVARSKLTNAYFDSTLATVSTLRNWRTVVTLLEMAEAPEGAAVSSPKR
jgi:uncharacterized protein (DUF1697 family)